MTLLLAVVFSLVTLSLQPLLPVGWTKRPEPVLVGEFLVASDPALVRRADGYLMAYTCLDPLEAVARTLICAARSQNGIGWEPVVTADPIQGAVLRGRVGEWDENLESAYLLRVGDGIWLYYSGYRDEGNPARGFPAALGVARSTDGISFERIGSDPILAPTPGGFDSDAIYSPVILFREGLYTMIYVGHCYLDCEQGSGVRLLSATSDDGVTWKKAEEPVLEGDPGLSWMSDGAAEPALLCRDDGCTLFFTGLEGERRVIGVAQAEAPRGPWQVLPDPVLTPTPDGFDAGGTLAPFVLREAELWRMWYLAVSGDGMLSVGYAEAEAPP